MSCCEDHNDKESINNKTKKAKEELPKSFIGKYLYNLGKKDLEKEKNDGDHKGDCC